MAKKLKIRSKRKEKKRSQFRGDGESMKAVEPKALLTWFPGHMKTAMKDVVERIKNVDIILEVRDARSPLSTANESFIKQIQAKSRLIVFNKANLSNPENVKQWETWFSQQEVPFIFTNALEPASLMKIVQLAHKTIAEKSLKSNPDYVLKKRIKMMIVGLPNTGKSTIINRLSKRDASKVSDQPGITRQQLLVKVSKELEILDTPGIMPPYIKTQKQVLRLSALHAIPEQVTDAGDTACFIVDHLLHSNPNILSSFYKLEGFPEETEEERKVISVLELIARKRGCVRSKNEIDYERVYKIVINDFRKGNLGLISLESHPDFSNPT